MTFPSELDRRTGLPPLAADVNDRVSLEHPEAELGTEFVRATFLELLAPMQLRRRLPSQVRRAAAIAGTVAPSDGRIDPRSGLPALGRAATVEARFFEQARRQKPGRRRRRSRRR